MNQPKKPANTANAVGLGLALGCAVGITFGIVFSAGNNLRRGSGPGIWGSVWNK